MQNFLKVWRNELHFFSTKYLPGGVTLVTHKMLLSFLGGLSQDFGIDGGGGTSPSHQKCDYRTKFKKMPKYLVLQGSKEISCFLRRREKTCITKFLRFITVLKTIFRKKTRKTF